MNKANVLIIGGGVVGASVAYHLAERGCNDILLLEREARQGLGSTGKATGGVRVQFGTEVNIRLSQYSIDFFNNWDFDCGYEPRGYVFFATNDAELGYLRANNELQRSLGVKEAIMVDRESISELVPGMNCEDVIGGSFCSLDGFIDPLAVMQGFTQKAVEKGVRVETTSKVVSIKTVGGKVSAVQTSFGKIEAENVVLCTGAWAKDLAATAGIDLPVVPLRRQIVWAKAQEILSANLPMVIDIGSGFHFRPAKGSKEEMLFAYPDREETPGFKTDFDESFIPKVIERAKHRAEFLAEAEIIREKCRAGLYEISPDHHAILGSCEVEGLYLANGFSGHGVMHSPATGRALAEIILDGKASFLNVSCLSLDRFAKGELLHENAYI